MDKELTLSEIEQEVCTSLYYPVTDRLKAYKNKTVLFSSPKLYYKN